MSKKLFKNITAVVLAAALVFSFAACNKDDKGNIGDETPPVVVPSTEFDFIKDGTSDYKIVIPQSPSKIVLLASTEIQAFISQATGAVVDVIDDSQTAAYTAESKYILLGTNDITQGLELDFDLDRLGTKGYRIITKGKSIVISGATELGYGTLYGAYEFLYHTVGFETYSEDEIHLNKSDSVKLLDFDITEKPDIEWRMASTGSLYFNETLSRRMRMEQFADMWMDDYGQWHNYFKYLPKDVYNNINDPDNYHASWYSEDGQQLCLEAHGNGTERQLMISTVFEKMLVMVNANPDLQDFNFTQEDINTWCGCTACESKKNLYGTNAASVIHFLNEISDKFAQYFELQGSKREIYIYFFAYHRTTNAPVKTDAGGNYVPIDDSVLLRDNVIPFYCPISGLRRVSYNSAVNIDVANTMKKWKLLSDKIAFWGYSTSYSNYIVPIDAFSAMQQNYVWLKENDVYYLFDQGQHSQQSETGFTRLKAYLNAKLSWNVNADVQELTDSFFENYFKDAAPQMRAFYDSWRVHQRYLYDYKSIRGNEDSYKKAEYYPYNLLQSWLGYIDTAYSDIEKLKGAEPEIYAKLHDRITRESVFVRFILIELYPSYYQSNVLLQMKKQFKTDVQKLKISKYSETEEITVIWNNWGV